MIWINGNSPMILVVTSLNGILTRAKNIDDERIPGIQIITNPKYVEVLAYHPKLVLNGWIGVPHGATHLDLWLSAADEQTNIVGSGVQPRNVDV